MSPVRLSALAITIGLVGGMVAAFGIKADLPTRSGIEWVETSRTLPDFTLPATTGSLRKADFLGQWTLIGFGYLSCPDACPTMLVELRALNERVTAPIRIVFVSVDQKRDSLDELASYLGHFDTTFIGAVGDPGTTSVVAKSVGAQFTQANADGVIGHSVQYALIGPDASLKGLLRTGFHTGATAADLSRQLVNL